MFPVESARYKWRGLRDTYRVQLRKLKRPGLKGLTQSIITSRWEYFNDMSFVKDHIYLDVNTKSFKMKRFKNGLFDSTFEPEGNEDVNGFDDDMSNEYQNLGDLCETEMTEGDHVIDELKTDDGGEGYNGNCDTQENSKPDDMGLDDLNSRLGSEDNYFDKRSDHSCQDVYYTNSFTLFEDDNFCFLLSILPQLKSLPNKRNLYVRIKMQELLLNEVSSLHNGDTNG